MNISKGLCRDQAANSDRDIIAHWAWAIPILLIVAALGVRQIDLYPPATGRVLFHVQRRLSGQWPIYAI